MASRGSSSTQQRLHFDLSGHEPGTRFLFHVGLDDYPIRAHTEGTLEESRSTNRFLRLLPNDAITHYVDIEPPQYVAMLYSTKEVMVQGTPARQLTTMGIHIPKQARMRDIERGLRDGDGGLQAKLGYRNLGETLTAARLEELAAAPHDIASYQDAFEVAVALLFQHPELINLNKGSLRAIIGDIDPRF